MANASEILQEIAQKHNCGFTAFRQINAVNLLKQEQKDKLDDGICYGLALQWLEKIFSSLQSGKDSEKSIAKFLDRSLEPRAKTFKRNFELWEKQSKLNIDETKFKKVGFEWDAAIYGKAPVNTRRRLLAEMDAIFQQKIDQLDDVYVLIQIPRHSMAMTFFKDGRIKFFDPNAGIISSSDAKAIKACMKDYLGHEVIEKEYTKDNASYHCAILQAPKRF